MIARMQTQLIAVLLQVQHRTLAGLASLFPVVHVLEQRQVVAVTMLPEQAVVEDPHVMVVEIAIRG